MTSVAERAAAERVEAEAHLAAMQAAERRAVAVRTAAANSAAACATAALTAAEEKDMADSLLVQAQDARTGAPVTAANVVVGMRVLPGYDFQNTNLVSLLETGGVISCTADVAQNGTCKVIWDAWPEYERATYSVGGANHCYELVMFPPPAAVYIHNYYIYYILRFPSAILTHARLVDGETFGGAQTKLPASASPDEVSRRRAAVLRVIVGATNNTKSYTSITVRRAHVLAESMRALGAPGGPRWKNTLSARFEGEAGIGPGVEREWFSAMSDAASSLPCFVLTQSEDSVGASYLDPAAVADPDALTAAAFIGALMGKVIRDSSGKDGNQKHHMLGGLRLALPLFRHLAGEDVGPERLCELDPAQASSLAAMLATPGGANNLGGASHALETYAADGQMRVYDLLPNGADVAVTEANKADYVRLRALWWLTTGVQPLLTALLDGFDTMVPRDVVKALGMSGLELQTLICGTPVLDLADVRRHTRLGAPYTVNSLPILWLWEVLESFSAQLQLRFWRFCTSSTNLPAGGAAALAVPFSIVTAPRTFGPGLALRLPVSHTCFWRLDLPMYESKEELERCLITALENSADSSFGLL